MGVTTRPACWTLTTDEVRSIYGAPRNVFNALGDKQWELFIDGRHAIYGKEVYDKGLHKSFSEPGYLESCLAASEFISAHLGTPTTPKLYLKVHAIACRHFTGNFKESATFITASEAGAFRSKKVSWNLSPYQVDYLSRTGMTAYLKAKGFSVIKKNKMKYMFSSIAHIRSRFIFFLDNYHEKIHRASNREEVLFAIAEFTQNCQRIHAVTDGSGRLDTLFLNKHLVENGFTPVILYDPYVSTILSTEKYVDVLKRGMEAWEIALEGSSRPVCLDEPCEMRKFLKLSDGFRVYFQMGKFEDAASLIPHLPLECRFRKDAIDSLPKSFVDPLMEMSTSPFFGFQEHMALWQWEKCWIKIQKGRYHTELDSHLEMLVTAINSFKAHILFASIVLCLSESPSYFIEQEKQVLEIEVTIRPLAHLKKYVISQELPKIISPILHSSIKDFHQMQEELTTSTALAEHIAHQIKMDPSIDLKNQAFFQISKKYLSVKLSEAERVANLIDKNSPFYSYALSKIARAWLKHGEFRLATATAEQIPNPYFRMKTLNRIHYPSKPEII